MKKIILILVAAMTVSTVSAQSILIGGKQQDSTVVRKHPRSPFVIKRIDREINRNSFVLKGEWMAGVTASYATLSTDDTDLALILENLKLGGSIVSVKPFFGYAYRRNQSIGMRLGYTHMKASFDNAAVNLGDFINGINFSTNESVRINYLSNGYTFGFFHRSYVAIDARGRFGVFGELELMGSVGRSEFGFYYNDEWQTSLSDLYKVRLSFNPGLAVYLFPNVCATVSFGLGGLQYSHTKQFDADHNYTGGRDFSKLKFRLNITEINIGVNVHLWSKKNEQKMSKK